MPRPQAASPCICGGKAYAKGMCRLHYERVMRSLRAKPSRPRKNKNTQGCCEPGCPYEYHALGRCQRHYQKWKRSFLPARPPRPSFYNPLVPKVEEMALTLPPRIIAPILGLTRNAVIGIIWRARQMGRLRNPKDRVYVPTPDRFPRPGCCLWMHGDPKDPAAHFCGEPAFVFGGVWCAEHAAIVFYRPKTDLSNLDPEQIRVREELEAAD